VVWPGAVKYCIFNDIEFVIISFPELETGYVMNILVVEDDPLALSVLTLIIEPFAKFDTATDGEHAIQKYILAYDKAPYDVVFLDLHLPRFDGQTVLEKIRQIEKEEGLEKKHRSHIVITTVVPSSEKILHDFSDLYDGYLEKPVNRQEIICQLRSLGYEVEY